MASNKNIILDRAVAAMKLRRMALEILEDNAEEKELIIAGIREKGAVLARSLQKLLEELSDVKIVLVDIILDKENPRDVRLGEPTEMNSRVVIIVDDVVNSGKTLTYALKPFLEQQPKKISIGVLVERTHTNFPVRPDYVGLSIASTLQEQITVELENGEVTGAYLA